MGLQLHSNSYHKTLKITLSLRHIATHVQPKCQKKKKKKNPLKSFNKRTHGLLKRKEMDKI
jgi:hypothetical protein